MLLFFKDRNPIGKFKYSPNFKGVITIFIHYEGIHHDKSFFLNIPYDESIIYSDMKHAFTAHLDPNIFYTISLQTSLPGDGKLVCHPSKTSFEERKTRKYKYNVSFNKYKDPIISHINRSLLIQRFDDFIRILSD